jgi:hypothetical protein
MKSFRTFLENVGEFASNLRAYQNSPATIRQEKLQATKERLEQRRKEAAERVNAIRQKEEQQRKAAERVNAIRQKEEQQRKEKD